ncbi:MAG TPA: hypothetical protein VLZ83_15855 [Edaphocola sp.]|nr:hypothetical protein [Edaphocola sp.]
MKFNPILILMLIVSILLSQASCKKKTYDDTPLASQWILPILKGNITPLTITTLKNKKLNLIVTGDDLGISTNSPTSSPIPLSFLNVKSDDIETNNLIESIVLDTCLIDVKITNNFPVTILAGTKIKFKQAGSLMEIMNFTLDNNLPMGQNKTFELDLSGKTIGYKIIVEIEELKIDAYSNETFSEDLTFDFLFKNVSVHELNIFTNQEYLNMRDTAEFDGSAIEFNEFDNKITDSTVNATFRYTSSNGLPINSYFQTYFLDDFNQVIDSIFTPNADMPGAEYDGTTFEKITESKGTVFVPKSRIEKIKNAKKIVYVLELNSKGYSGAFITIKKEQKFDLKIVGDLKLILNSNIFN